MSNPNQRTYLSHPNDTELNATTYDLERELLFSHSNEDIFLDELMGHLNLVIRQCAISVFDEEPEDCITNIEKEAIDLMVAKL